MDFKFKCPKSGDIETICVDDWDIREDFKGVAFDKLCEGSDLDPLDAFDKYDDWRFLNGDCSYSPWYDINSAPKDGAVFLGFEKGYGWHECYWDESHDCGAGGFRTPHHGWRPTHWMPGPKPPAEDKEELSNDE